MNARLVFACAATGIALTVFAAAPAAATAGPIAVVAAEGQPTTPAEPPVTGSPTEPPAEPAPGSPTEPPVDAPAPPQQVPVTPRGGADTGSLDPAPQQGSDVGVIALGGMVLLAAGGLGVATHRRRQRT